MFVQAPTSLKHISVLVAGSLTSVLFHLFYCTASVGTVTNVSAGPKAHSVELSWNLPNRSDEFSAIIRYAVDLELAYRNSPDNNFMELNVTTRKASFNGLLPYSRYKYNIVAFTASGLGRTFNGQFMTKATCESAVAVWI